MLPPEFICTKATMRVQISTIIRPPGDFRAVKESTPREVSVVDDSE